MGKEPAFIHTELADRSRECPVCHRVCDAYTAVSVDADDPVPSMKPGDVTLCAYCGTILMVTTIGWRPATEAEVADLSPNLRTLLFSWKPHGRRTPKQ
jgi:hypothetical protein